MTKNLVTQQHRTLNINLWAGPGVGKSTTAAGVFYHLKLAGVSAHLVPEHAKNLFYAGKLEKATQQSILEKQYELQALSQGQVEVVVTDAPVPLSIWYARVDEKPELEAFVTEHTASWLQLDVLLHRNLEGAYEQAGRYQTVTEAIEVQNSMAEFVRRRFGSALLELQVGAAVNTLTDRIVKHVTRARQETLLARAA